MAYEAVESLQQTLRIILLRDDGVITTPVKHQIISIHDKAVVLQFNLKHFPDKETTREVANTTEEIIQYLFSPQYLSDFGSKNPTVRLSDQLGELAEELESTVGYMVDYCKINGGSGSPAVSVGSSSRSALKSQVEDLPVELLAIYTNGLRRLADKILSTGREVADDDPSDRPSISPLASKDVAAGFDDDLSDSAVAASSSRPAPTSKYFVADFAEDPSDSPSIYPPTSRDDVVGIDEDILQMIDRITGNSRDQDILPIVGMGGIGKSTLAKIVYDDPSIKQHFDVRAWVTISQDYSEESILSQLLASLNRKVDVDGRDSLEVITDEMRRVYQNLWGRRYLIVMDDMWSVEAWDCVRRFFPDNSNRSRIILTTRQMDVATAISRNIHMMRFLDDEQSWRLFQRKVFGDQDCPLDLQSVGQKIVRGCGGLPLKIVTMAGLLSRIPSTPKSWQQIEVNDGQLESILSLSYNILPTHLRKCFLYMSGFPEDYEIRNSELIKLWIAEGFMEQRNKSKSAEVAAEECLEDLIKQSLVLAISRKIDGKTKSCRLHSMVRDFCVRQAGQEKFLLSVMDYFSNPILRRHFLPQVLQNHRRIGVSCHDLHLKDSTHSSCTTSIICSSQRGYKPKGSVDNFTSLRVLHVLRRNDHSYWELGQVFELIYLTYLASNIPDSIVPPAIAKLQNLQTLIIYRSGVRLPVEIWSLRQLRHLIAFSFHPLLLPEGASLSLENLQTLSMATNFVCSERMVKMIPNIKKLGICYSGEKFGAGYHLGNLIHLLRLEKLKLEVHSSFAPHLDNLVFPPSLIKLELSGGCISWNNMTIVGSLPKLQVLTLKNYACHGEQWETIDGEFGNLIHLLIDQSNLKCWTTDSSHFPRLQCLTLHRCPYLDEIPYEIGEIPTLQLIEVDGHSQSLMDSAKEIQQEQLEYGNEGLEVHVKRS
ncbi:putative late blight resistance protein R1B-16 [Salvia divinorum]|uniref:Late blight resistance protein R1B-16 n=1 Tax=Salvia divinorum TaxID=28513 RepID=A0ABD1GRM8_SALDI